VIPIVNSSPLTIVPLTGYLLVLVIDFFQVAGEANKLKKQSKSKSRKKKNIPVEDSYRGLLDQEEPDNVAPIDEENPVRPNEFAERPSIVASILSSLPERKKDSLFIKLIWIP
jgi:hypothetical protein